MIRVLVVDDEKLVRQGIISSLPWDRFGMQVVGEAKNGEKAVEFLERNEVDLMLTDLAMPVMSGIELMRIARKRYPDLYIIVLTLHQDFEYIQEALRLGAIDYIAKVELSQDRFHEILERIHARIVEEERKKGGQQVDGPAGPGPGPGEAGRNAVPAGGEPRANDRDAGPAGRDDPANDGRRRSLEVGGDDRADDGQAVSVGREYGEAGRDGGAQAAPDVADRPRDVAEAAEIWSGLAWIHNDEQFSANLERMKALRLSPSELARCLDRLREGWSELSDANPVDGCRSLPETGGWSDVKAWFAEARAALGRSLDAPNYSREVQDAVAKAVQLIQEQLGGQLFAADIAKRVNMSRSYFSQCFRDLTGRTFNDYVRHARVDKAKEYLLHTNRPIQWIAEKTGYTDGKYFSNVFREQTGMLPSAYRKMNGR